MKKVIKLTESDLLRIVEKIIAEQENGTVSAGLPPKPNNEQYVLTDFFAGGKAAGYPLNSLGQFYSKGVFPKTLIGDQTQFREYIKDMGVFKDNPAALKGIKQQFCNFIKTPNKVLLLMSSTNPDLNGVTAPVKWLCDGSGEFLIVDLKPNSVNKLTVAEAKKLASVGQIDYSVAAPHLLKKA